MQSIGGVLWCVVHWWCVLVCGPLVVCSGVWSIGGVFWCVVHW